LAILAILGLYNINIVKNAQFCVYVLLLRVTRKHWIQKYLWFPIVTFILVFIGVEIFYMRFKQANLSRMETFKYIEILKEQNNLRRLLKQNESD